VRGWFNRDGNSIQNWIDENGAIQANFTEQFDERYAVAVDPCIGQPIASITHYWFQGEGDAGSLANAILYYARLNHYIDAFTAESQSRWGLSPNYVLAGVWKQNLSPTLQVYMDTVRAAIFRTADERANVAAYDTSDIDRPNDDVHIGGTTPGMKLAAYRALIASGTVT